MSAGDLSQDKAQARLKHKTSRASSCIFNMNYRQWAFHPRDATHESPTPASRAPTSRHAAGREPRRDEVRVLNLARRVARDLRRHRAEARLLRVDVVGSFGGSTSRGSAGASEGAAGAGLGGRRGRSRRRRPTSSIGVVLLQIFRNKFERPGLGHDAAPLEGVVVQSRPRGRSPPPPRSS